MKVTIISSFVSIPSKSGQCFLQRKKSETSTRKDQKLSVSIPSQSGHCLLHDFDETEQRRLIDVSLSQSPLNRVTVSYSSIPVKRKAARDLGRQIIVSIPSQSGHCLLQLKEDTS